MMGVRALKWAEGRHEGNRGERYRRGATVDNKRGETEEEMGVRALE